MSEARSAPRQGMTPCLVARGTLRYVNEQDGNSGTKLSVHSRTSPCGHAYASSDQPIPTFAEWVESWCEDNNIRFNRCGYCGGEL